MSLGRERRWFERTANDMVVQRARRFLAGAEMVALQHLRDPCVEALDPLPGKGLPAIAGRRAVGLRMLRCGKAVWDAGSAAQLIERVLAGGVALAQTEPAVGELAADTGEPDPDLHPSPGRATDSRARRP